MAVLTGHIIAEANKDSNSVPTALGPNSRLTVELQDVSLMDAPSVTLGEYIFITGSSEYLQFPIPFRLKYDITKVQPNQSISIAARVVDVSTANEELKWTTTSRFSVITMGCPSDNVDVSISYLSPSNETMQSQQPITLNTLSGKVVASQTVPTPSSAAGIGPNSKVQVQLLDVSLMDVPSVTLATQLITTGPNESRAFPINFSLQYDPNGIDERHTYLVSVRVEDMDSEDLIWITTTAYHVLTRNEPTDSIQVDIDLL
ncbi:hypothetical protein BX616_000520 [Lobosporangium transversale]|uniref:Uncharacterized protein n=1 Tax=Lobosporangium transversale TaxID=64571 RepID=A0A1Y2GW29_9FUNG|nr:hypothetical protein BCR41DRAFT_348412 [Lobosporangium transversale]KAF9907157.1 hypothetical protein BX616_000520 [Lobosporangium transversale]ORZ26508.1 hypothetical protein BCR41DRAFT_348412 [Lobosporangium transversale]|eukprot:XP_021884273.1 hypothetical protein BCR41DRAFT_348412 [Lobosporangium transversale]